MLNKPLSRRTFLKQFTGGLAALFVAIKNPLNLFPDISEFIEDRNPGPDTHVREGLPEGGWRKLYYESGGASPTIEVEALPDETPHRFIERVQSIEGDPNKILEPEPNVFIGWDPADPDGEVSTLVVREESGRVLYTAYLEPNMVCRWQVVSSKSKVIITGTDRDGKVVFQDYVYPRGSYEIREEKENHRLNRASRKIKDIFENSGHCNHPEFQKAWEDVAQALMPSCLTPKTFKPFKGPWNI